MRTARLVAILGVIFLASGVGAAGAGTITGTAVAGPGGFGSGSTVTGLPNNDDSVGFGNTNNIILSETFASIAPIDAVFTVADSTPAGTTEYFATNVTVNNNTGVTWTDFHFQLIPTIGGDNLDFDFPNQDPPPSSTAFTVPVHLEDTIDWSGGAVADGSFAVFTFSIDVPDSFVGQTFTLQSVPTVPEPSTAAIVGSGLLSLFGYGWWRRNRANRAGD